MSAALVILLFAVHQPSTTLRDPAAVRRDAVISGRVTERDSGRPLPRIVVTLTRIDRSAPLEIVTDEDGRYEFTGVEPGEYALSARPDPHRSTYLPQRYGADTPGLSGAEPPRSSFAVTAGERRSGLDIALWRALAVEGRVVDPWENGMANVAVLVTPIGRGVRPAAGVFTDDRGVFRAYGLAPGRYRVCVEIQELSGTLTDDARLASTCYPASTDEGGAGEVVVTSQDVNGIDIRIQQFRSYAISGGVAGADGSAVDGAFVSAYPLDGRGPTASGTTRRGEFVLNGLAPGRYLVVASLTEPNHSAEPPLQEVEAGYAPVDLLAGSAASVTVSLSRPVDVPGRVTFAGATPSSSRRRGMVVHAGYDDEGRSVSRFARPRRAAVADDLSFELKRLHSLPAVVWITGLPDGWILQSVRSDGRDVTHVPIAFGGGPSPGRLELIVTNRVAQPTVRVAGEEGKPITTGYAIAVPADPGRRRHARALVAVRVDAGGPATLGPLLPGDYIVAAIPRDDADLLFTDRTRIDGLAAIGRRVTLVEGDSRTFDLRLVSLPAKQ